MDLLNATGEILRQKYDGVVYIFEPNELVRVEDPCGRHMLKKLKMRGLQEVKYGDDPTMVSYNALSSVVAFHRKQIEDHEISNQEQVDQKLRELPEPPSVKLANRALKIYEPLLEAAQEEMDAKEEVEFADTVRTHVKAKPEMPDLEGQSLEQLKKTLVAYGGEPGRMRSRAKLIKAIKEKAGDRVE